MLDVAHNPHAAAALAVNLDAMGFFPTTHAVFGAMADKDLLPMFERLNPIIDRWYFTDLPIAPGRNRRAPGDTLAGASTRARTPRRRPSRDPVQALQRSGRCGRPG